MLFWNRSTSYGGRDYYDWTAYLDGPLGLLRQVASIEYFLHPSFPQNVIEIRQGQDYGFPLSSCGWGEFMLRGSVHFRNGTFLELTHPLQLFAR